MLKAFIHLNVSSCGDICKLGTMNSILFLKPCCFSRLIFMKGSLKTTFFSQILAKGFFHLILINIFILCLCVTISALASTRFLPT